jgi:hypothetical protein
MMNPQCQNIDTVVIYQRALVLRDTGELIKQPIPVYFLGWQLLGALVVYEDEGVVHHELVLNKDRLKTVDDASFLLRAGAHSVDDLDRVAGLLEDRLKQLVDHAITKVGFNDHGVYFVILGDPCEGHKHGL